jgi:hypothetical protein
MDYKGKGHLITGHQGPSALCGGWVVDATLRLLYPWESPGTHCTGVWAGPIARLDVYGKSRPHRDSILGPSSP